MCEAREQWIGGQDDKIGSSRPVGTENAKIKKKPRFDGKTEAFKLILRRVYRDKGDNRKRI
jgi:hypothetical protein